MVEKSKPNRTVRGVLRDAARAVVGAGLMSVGGFAISIIIMDKALGLHERRLNSVEMFEESLVFGASTGVVFIGNVALRKGVNGLLREEED